MVFLRNQSLLGSSLTCCTHITHSQGHIALTNAREEIRPLIPGLMVSLAVGPEVRTPIGLLAEGMLRHALLQAGWSTGTGTLVSSFDRGGGGRPG